MLCRLSYTQVNARQTRENSELRFALSELTFVDGLHEDTDDAIFVWRNDCPLRRLLWSRNSSSTLILRASRSQSRSARSSRSVIRYHGSSRFLASPGFHRTTML